MKKRIVALFISLAFVFSVFPFSVFAEDISDKSTVVSSVEESDDIDQTTGTDETVTDLDKVEDDNDIPESSEEPTEPEHNIDDTLDKAEESEKETKAGEKVSSGDDYDFKVNGETQCELSSIMNPFIITVDIPLIDDPESLYVTLYSDSHAVRFDFSNENMNIDIVGSDGDEYELIYIYMDEYFPIESVDGYLHLSLPGYISADYSERFISGEDIILRSTAGFNFQEGTPINIGDIKGEVPLAPQIITISYSGSIVHVDGISFKDDVIVIGLGEYSFIPEIVVTPFEATNKNVIWSSSDESVFSVDEVGRIYPQNVGTATLTAVTIDGGFSDTCEVRIEIPVTSLTIDKDEVNLLSGERVSLIPTILPENATNKTVIWTSSDETVATVDSEGVVTAVAEGEAIITATTESGNKKVECSVTVTKLVIIESITLSTSILSIAKWDSYHLEATIYPDNAFDKTLVWSSSDPSVATVEDGDVYALSEGMSVISVSSADGSVTADCIVYVNEPESGSISWTIDDGVLIISGSGVMDDYESASDSPWYGLRDEITKIIVGDGITRIGSRSFFNCSLLSELVIGKDVKSIGVRAFQNCASLPNIEMPEHLKMIEEYAFYGCSCEIVFTGNAPILGTSAIKDGTNIYYYEDKTGYDDSFSSFNTTSMHYGEWEIITEPTCTEDGEKHIYCSYCQKEYTETIPTLGHDYVDGVCSRCGHVLILSSGRCGNNATYILYGSGLLKINGNGAMSSSRPWSSYNHSIKQVVIGEGITSICDMAFYGCDNIVNVSLPNSLASIGNYSFENCKALQSVIIPDGVSSIGSGAFFYCENLLELTLPDNLTSIGTYAFGLCKSLTYIVIPDNVTSISDKAFASCNALRGVYIPSGVLTIGESTNYLDSPFNGCNSHLYIFCEDNTIKDGWASFWNYSSQNKIIPTYFGIEKEEVDYWFGFQTQEESIIIPENITVIPPYAFYKNSALSSVTLSESVKSIGDYAFYGCTSLKSVSLKNGLTSIGNGAFYYCTSLKRLFIPSSVITIDTSSSMPFCWCSTELVLFCEIDYAPSTWPNNWNYRSGGNSPLMTYYGINRDVYDYWDSIILIDQHVAIPDFITFIPKYSFSGWSDLRSIAIPSSVNMVDQNAFANCTNLTDVYYAGSYQEREQMVIDNTSYGNRNLLSADWHYMNNPEPEINTISSQNSKVTVIWDSISGVKRYAVFRKTDISDWTLIAQTEQTSYIDYEVLSGDLYCYSIRCIDVDELTYTSDYSSYKSIIVNPFKDVKSNAYYYNALMWAYQNNVIAGTSSDTFSPNDNCTRGQLAVMIYRMFGKPSIAGKTIPFTDVKSSDYFYKAVVWAYNEGIINGTSSTKFSPNSSITRQDLVVMLWRMQNKPKVSATNPFTDVTESMYSYKAIMWAYKIGVTSGTSATTFSPKDQCTRAQIAAFLYKYNKMFHVI